MNIAIGTDHRGFALKELIKHMSFDKPVSWIDVGSYNTERSDYPLFAQKVCQLILSNQVQYGVLLCATGIGMSIAANRFTGIRAALVWDKTIAQLSKEEENANILVLPAEYIAPEQAQNMIALWLTAAFKGGRYQERIEQVNTLNDKFQM